MSNEIVKREEQFVANTNMDDLQDELAGMSITFDKIKVPSGGGLAFEVPGINPDEPDLQKEIKAVILYHHPMLSYYKEKYTGGSEAPDCSSIDGVTGVERDTGEMKLCKDCPYNQFDSGENGGKACKTRRRIFILREGKAFPTILSLPTASMREFQVYIKNLIESHRKSNQVVTKFSLKKETNKTGITYSKVMLSFDRDLTDVEKENISKMSEQTKSIAKNLQETNDTE